MKKQIIVLSIVALLALSLFVIAGPATSLTKPTVIDGYVHTGATTYTSKAVGVPMTVACLHSGSVVQSTTTDANGYFKVILPAGQCSVNDWVAVSGPTTVKNRKLMIETSQINLLGFTFFNGG